uniref:Uncharacterized protein n=1 Tax=viral metagenome TaxID=1070528 RepID=A0A6M3LIY4_9ZZZZ
MKVTKNIRDIAIFFGGLFFVLSIIPFLDDPFHQEGKVCFWTWLYREGFEVLNGEQ